MAKIKQINNVFNPSPQAPIDIRVWFKTIDDLVNLGTNNVKAKTYYKGMWAYVLEDNSVWRWQEWDAVDDADKTAALSNGYTYPSCWKTDEYDYSNKTFNFVRLYLENQYYPENPLDAGTFRFLDTINDVHLYNEYMTDKMQLGAKFDNSGKEIFAIYQLCLGCTDNVDDFNVLYTYNGTGRWILQTVLKDARTLNGLTDRNTNATQPYIPIADGNVNTGLNSDTVDSFHAGNNSNMVSVNNGILNNDLNSDMVDGLHVRDDANHNTGKYIPIADGTINPVLNSDKLDGYDAGNGNGHIPINNGTINNNLNADMLHGYIPYNVGGQDEYIVVSEQDGKIDNGWLKMGHNNGIDADTVDGFHYQDIVNQTKYVVSGITNSFTFSANVFNQFFEIPTITSGNSYYAELHFMFDSQPMKLECRIDYFNYEIIALVDYRTFQYPDPFKLLIITDNNGSNTKSIKIGFYSNSSLSSTKYIKLLYYKLFENGDQINANTTYSTITDANLNNDNYSTYSRVKLADITLTNSGKYLGRFSMNSDYTYSSAPYSYKYYSYDIDVITHGFYISGDANATAFNTTSDINLKDNIIDLNINEVSDIINGLPNSISYEINGDKAIGFPAQNINIGSEFLVKNTNGHLSVNYTSIIPLLVDYIKYLEQRISNLENQ